MSNFSWSRSKATEPAAQTVNHDAPHRIHIEAVPKPRGTNEYDPEKARTQSAALKEFRTAGKDLFDANECKVNTKQGTTLYQTQETYGTSMSIEQAIEDMKKHDITMRVNFHRPGMHSNVTCMELSHANLEECLKSTADDKGQKTVELRVAAEAKAQTPRNGAIFATIRQRGTQHYLSHVDYRIMSSYDSMYHEE